MPQQSSAALQFPASGQGVRRRDFINVAAVSVAGVGGLFVLDPLISQMEPSADVLASGAPITVDIGKIAPGQQIVTIWRSMPIFIANRTPAELATLRQPSLRDHLRDPDSKVRQQPEYATNWSRSIKPEYLGASIYPSPKWPRHDSVVPTSRSARCGNRGFSDYRTI
ncbi:MAG: ubiquinol-cytochrome c reductase iron-sulfur subunit [Sphingomonadales bacterium]|nr:ubiquinol-cytochrome c reductase iron-sulfur subunit [Sphingomonadales bacterium]MDE2570055.1 ubiquinol-cytochrome c reductase iron-sulfur subunit [Sphingomonadales bacterium]